MKKLTFIFIFLLINLFAFSQNFQWADGYQIFWGNQNNDMFSDQKHNIVVKMNLFNLTDVQYGPNTFMLDTINNNSSDNALVKYNHDTVEFGYNCPFFIQDISFTSNNDYVLLCQGYGIFDVDLAPVTTQLMNFSAYGAQGSRFLLRISETGTFISAKRIDMKNAPLIDLQIDRQNNIILAGTFFTSMNMNTDPLNPIIVYSTGGVNDRDAFIAKYDLNYNLLWHEEITGSKNQTIDHLITDTSNNIVVTGRFKDTTDFDPTTAQNLIIQNYNNAPTNTGEIFILKVLPSGLVDYVRILETHDVGPEIWDLKIDRKNNILIAGRNSDYTDYDPGSNIKQIPFGAFLLKLNNLGNYQYANSYNPGEAFPNLLGAGAITSLAIDSNNNYYGIAYSSANSAVDFDCSLNVDLFWSTWMTGVQGFMVKTKENGDHIWGRGFKDLDILADIALNQDNEVYIFGRYTHQYGDFDPSPATFNLPLLNSSGNLFMAKYDNSCPFIPPPALVSDTVCIGDSLHLNIPVPAMGNYYWWQGTPPSNFTTPALSTGNPVTFPPSYNSTHVVVMDSLSNGCYSTTVMAEFSKDGPPNPALNNIAVCPGANANQIIQSTAVGTYYWYTDPASAPFTSGNNYITPNVTSPISYFIKDSVTGGCSSLPYQCWIDLYNSPQTPLFASPTTVCYNDFSNYASLNSAYNLQWYIDTNSSPILSAPNMYILAQSDTLLYIRDSTGVDCFSPYATLEIHVDTLANFSAIASKNAICLGDTVSISANGPYTFSINPSPNWNIGNTFYYIPTTSNVYTVTAMNSANCTKDIVVNIDVNTIVTPIIQFLNNKLFIGPNGYTSKNWYLNNNLLVSNTDTITISSNGTYSVIVSNAFGCEATATYTVNGLGLTNAINIPYQYFDDLTNTTIIFSKEINVDYTLFSSTGQFIHDGKVQDRQITISKRGLSTGIYYLKFNDQEQSYTLKLIVK